MTTNQVGRVSSFEDIQECQDLDPMNSCFFLTVQEPGNTNINLQCLDLAAVADLDEGAMGTTHNLPSLSQYNSAFPQLIQDGYTEVCSMGLDEDTGKYMLVSIANPNTTRGTLSPPGTQAPPARPAPGIPASPATPSPVTQQSTQQQSTAGQSPNGTMFERCRQELGDGNGPKIELDVELTEREARYLVEKLGSTDHIIGCYIAQINGKYKLWITNQPARINDAISAIDIDWFQGKLPEGMDSNRARELMRKLEVVKATFPAEMQAKSTEEVLEGQESFKFWVVLMGIMSALVGGLSVLAAWRLSKRAIDASREAAKSVLEGRLGREATIEDITVNVIEEARQELAPDNPRRNLNRIRYRDAEALQYLMGLDRMRNANPLLIGPSGAGKDIVVKRAAQLIIERDSRVPPRHLDNPNLIIRRVIPDAFQADTKWVGTPSERVKLLREAMQRGEIVYFPELADFVGAGSSSQGMHSSLGSLMKEILTLPYSKWSGSGTEAGAERMFGMPEYKDLERRLQIIRVGVMLAEEIRSIMIEQYAPEFAKYHGVTYSNEVVEAAIRQGAKYHLKEGSGAVIDAINVALEDAMQLAAMDARVNGTPAVVTKEHVYRGVENRLGKSIPRDESDGPDDQNPPPAPSGDSGLPPVQTGEWGVPGSDTSAKYSYVPWDYGFEGFVPDMCTARNPYGRAAWEPVRAYGPYVMEPRMVLATPEGITFRSADIMPPVSSPEGGRGPQIAAETARSASMVETMTSVMRNAAGLIAAFPVIGGLNSAFNKFLEAAGISNPLTQAAAGVGAFFGGHTVGAAISTPGLTLAQAATHPQSLAAFKEAGGRFFALTPLVTGILSRLGATTEAMHEKLGSLGTDIAHAGTIMLADATVSSTATTLSSLLEAAGLRGSSAFITRGMTLLSRAGWLGLAAFAMMETKDWLRTRNVSEQEQALTIALAQKVFESDIGLEFNDKVIPPMMNMNPLNRPQMPRSYGEAVDLLDAVDNTEMGRERIASVKAEMDQQIAQGAQALRTGLVAMLYRDIAAQADNYDGSGSPVSARAMLEQRLSQIFNSPLPFRPEPPRPQYINGGNEMDNDCDGTAECMYIDSVEQADYEVAIADYNRMSPYYDIAGSMLARNFTLEEIEIAIHEAVSENGDAESSHEAGLIVQAALDSYMRTMFENMGRIETPWDTTPVFDNQGEIQMAIKHDNVETIASLIMGDELGATSLSDLASRADALSEVKRTAYLLDHAVLNGDNWVIDTTSMSSQEVANLSADINAGRLRADYTVNTEQPAYGIITKLAAAAMMNSQESQS